jgi:hypothetical protein
MYKTNQIAHSIVLVLYLVVCTVLVYRSGPAVWNTGLTLFFTTAFMWLEWANWAKRRRKKAVVKKS